MTTHEHLQVSGEVASAVATAVDLETDDVLIARYLQGEVTAFEALYRRYKGPVYRFFIRQLPAAVANDVFQDTWTKLIANLQQYDPRGQFQAYLFRIAHNALVDFHRQNQRHPQSSEALSEMFDDTQNPEAVMDQQRLQAVLDREIRQLPLNQRTVWLIKQESALSLKEIATLTGSTVEGVKSRLRYANEKLQARLKKYV